MATASSRQLPARRSRARPLPTCCLPAPRPAALIACCRLIASSVMRAFSQAHEIVAEMLTIRDDLLLAEQTVEGGKKDEL